MGDDCGFIFLRFAQKGVEKQCIPSDASIDSPKDRGNTRNVNANYSTAYPQAAGAKCSQVQVAALGILPAKARRLHPRLHNHPEKAELCYAESRQGASDQQL